MKYSPSATSAPIAAGAISALQLVTPVSGATVRAAQVTDPYPMGIATTAANSGGSVNVKQAGALEDAFWNWTPGLPIFATDSGALTQTPPAGGYLVSVGYALSATTIMVRIAPAILRV